ncbi:MAG TPA: hypothetical protein VM571_13660 [Noviherbaspirillum sp.]|nr:hypothetical protein [Noviherbaspirillum sp.]
MMVETVLWRERRQSGKGKRFCRVKQMQKQVSILTEKVPFKENCKMIFAFFITLVAKHHAAPHLIAVKMLLYCASCREKLSTSQEANHLALQGLL